MEGREPNFTDPWMLVVLWAHAWDRRHAARLSVCLGRLKKCYMSWTFGVPCEQLNLLILHPGKWGPHVTIATYWSQVSGVFVLFMFLCWCLRNSRKIGHSFSHSCFGQWHWHRMLGSPTWLQEPRGLCSARVLIKGNPEHSFAAATTDWALMGGYWAFHEKKGVIFKQIWETLLKRINCVDFCMPRDFSGHVIFQCALWLGEDYSEHLADACCVEHALNRGALS